MWAGLEHQEGNQAGHWAQACYKLSHSPISLLSQRAPRTSARSPVLNQPPGANAARVAASSRQ
jgi:hypothetical protein